MPKSWGPFSGRQLTVIIVTAIVALFVPGTVWAVDTFSNVAIEDPVSGVKASVDAGHHLLIGDGSGPLTVNGAVTATETAPATFVRVLGFRAASTCGSPFYTVPSGKALIIKSLVFYSHSSSLGTDAEIDLFSGTTNSACNTLIGASVSDRADETVPEDTAPGIGVPTGGVLAANGNNQTGSVMVYGYLVPASSVPPTAAAGRGSAPTSTTSPTTSR